jgi:hypothetical protein
MEAQMKKLILASALAAATTIGFSATAFADGPNKATPDPFETPDLPGCFGNLNATLNHGSSMQGHGKDSKGPGWFFRDGQAFQEIRSELWPEFCGPGAGVG